VKCAFEKQCWGTHWECEEHAANPLGTSYEGTHWEQKNKFQHPHPSPKENNLSPWVHAPPPHWLQELCFAYLCSLSFLA